MPTPILIDTDTGVDDALALIFALRSPEISVKAITTVAGNVEVQKCTRNVLFLLQLLGMNSDVIVAEGASRPLRKKLFMAPEVHGRDGLGNTLLLKQMGKAKKNAVEEIINFCKRYKERGTIVALGPLTNLALALERNPAAIRKIGSVITMGGAFRVPGNTGPVAEFNYYVDPDAALQVLNSGLPATVVPLDVTERVPITRREFEHRARRNYGQVSQTILQFTKFYMQYHKETEGFYGGYAHDPMAVAIAVAPSLAASKRINVSVEKRDIATRGMTVATFRVRDKRKFARVNVVSNLNAKKFLSLFYARLWK